MTQTHARIRLKDADITSALGVGQSTVERMAVSSSLRNRTGNCVPQKRLDGEGARLLAMACGEPPEGRAKKLLADQLVECEIVGTNDGSPGCRTEAVAEAELVHPARSER